MSTNATRSGPDAPLPEAGSAPDLASIVVAEIDPSIDLGAVQRMLRDDRASAALGMRVTDLHLGRAVVTMEVTEQMLQGHGTCHGGYILTVADTAFACACDSHGPLTGAAAVQIVYVGPVYLGDLLTASATEVSRWGRNGLYDVEVRNDEGVVALFRGSSRTIERSAGERGEPSHPAERSQA